MAVNKKSTVLRVIRPCNSEDPATHSKTSTPLRNLREGKARNFQKQAARSSSCCPSRATMHYSAADCTS
jgi:hypothetical protein